MKRIFSFLRAAPGALVFAFGRFGWAECAGGRHCAGDNRAFIRAAVVLVEFPAPGRVIPTVIPLLANEGRIGRT